MKRIEIFRTGTHRSLQGQTLSFSEADLDDAATAYDPELHQAPLVIGHPQIDAPAYGWVTGLCVDGDRLVATPDQVEPAFSEMVEAGRFKKVSASFYSPTAAANPKPGHYYLRHVGFLGAAAPAVKGLRPIEFAGDETDVVTLEFADWTTASIALTVGRLFRGLRDWMIDRDGRDAADKVLPDWDVNALSGLAVEAQSDPSQTYAEDNDMDKEELAKREAALTAREAELKAREEAAAKSAAEFAEAETARIAADDAAFVAEAVAAGRLPKGLLPTAVALFGELGDGQVSFAEGDATKTGSPRQALRALISQLPLPVETRELVKGDDVSVDFADGKAVADAITTEIRAVAETGKEISPADALVRIRERGGK